MYEDLCGNVFGSPLNGTIFFVISIVSCFQGGYSLYIFYCHKLQQWGWVTSSRNISYDPPPTCTYTDQSKHVNMATKQTYLQLYKIINK